MNDAPLTPGTPGTPGSNAAAQPPQPQWHDLCATDEVPRDMGQFVKVAGKPLSVFRDGESFRVIDDMCPHAGASLSAGFVENGCVVCPWHFWEFDIKTGKCTNAIGAKVDTYEVRVEGDRVMAKV